MNSIVNILLFVSVMSTFSQKSISNNPSGFPDIEMNYNHMGARDWGGRKFKDIIPPAEIAVSYTHLTLPTIYSV